MTSQSIADLEKRVVADPSDYTALEALRQARLRAERLAGVSDASGAALPNDPEAHLAALADAVSRADADIDEAEMDKEDAEARISRAQNDLADAERAVEEFRARLVTAGINPDTMDTEA